MGVRAMWAERGWQKTSVACADRVLSRAGVPRGAARSSARAERGRRAPADINDRSLIAQDLLLRKLAGTCSRPSVVAVTQTSDRHTRHYCGECAGLPVKRLEQPLRTGTHKIARISRARLNFLLRSLPSYMCNIPPTLSHLVLVQSSTASRTDYRTRYSALSTIIAVPATVVR